MTGMNSFLIDELLVLTRILAPGTDPIKTPIITGAESSKRWSSLTQPAKCWASRYRFMAEYA